MRVALFCHSLLSDWNHGNAHFLRGVAAELTGRGHEVRVFEPRSAWSVANLVADHGESALEDARRAFPGLDPVRYGEQLDLDEALDGCGVVLVHEWNDPDLVRRIGEHRAAGGRYVLLFHDTHHRSVTRPEEIRRYDLSAYDGVLAFGESVRARYEVAGWARRAWTWHEAADTRIFRPVRADADVPVDPIVWIGNWGDDERTDELREFLFEPVSELGLRGSVFGVRYPDAALRALAGAGLRYRGWLPNARVPVELARHLFTVHVPRRAYARQLPGIPTIRVFEALACGVPLVCAPWEDAEGLFSPGRDYHVARTGERMREAMKDLVDDAEMRRELGDRGRAAILARHTCAHRVDELVGITRALGAAWEERAN